MNDRMKKEVELINRHTELYIKSTLPKKYIEMLKNHKPKLRTRIKWFFKGKPKDNEMICKDLMKFANNPFELKEGEENSKSP